MRYKTFRAIVLSVVGLGVVGSIALVATCRRSDPEPKAEKSAVAEPAAPKPTAKAPEEPASEPKAKPALTGDDQPLRAIDEQILAKLGKSLGTDKIKDAIPGAAKVSLYQDAGKSAPNRVKIDLDRDDKWDEKWTIEDDGGKPKVKRQIAPADDESYTVEYRLRDGKWVKKN